MTLTITQLAALLLCVFVAGGCFGGLIVAIFAGSREREPEPVGYVDQDGESTPAQHQWKNAGAKAHHAE